jgi:rRNA maturation protein Rpf1
VHKKSRVLKKLLFGLETLLVLTKEFLKHSKEYFLSEEFCTYFSQEDTVDLIINSFTTRLHFKVLEEVFEDACWQPITNSSNFQHLVFTVGCHLQILG